MPENTLVPSEDENESFFQTMMTTCHGMSLQLNSDNGRNKFAPLQRIDSIKDEILTP
jgi:hypothetical protein